MLCSISGQLPEEPVVSLKSGLLFEKRLIEHEIEEHGTCPITKEPLSNDDLVPIRVDKEWDAMMLECHSLRQSLSNARQELSHSLYQHDAACRVIARLIRERDEARNDLMALQSAKRDATEDEEETEEQPMKKMHVGVTEEMSEFIRLSSEKLAEERQEFKMSEEVMASEVVRNYRLIGSHPLHATKQGGIPALAFHKSLHSILATGGHDSTIQIFDIASHRILASIEEHFKSITDIDWMDDAFLLSASADKSVRLWLQQEDDWNMKCGMHLRDHDAEVVGVTCAQNGRFVISASRDGVLGMIDLEQGKCIEKLISDKVDGYTCAKFHPDGRWVATGTENGEVHLWDVCDRRIVRTISVDEEVKGVAFNENGREMATATDGAVRIWDLDAMAERSVLEPSEDGGIGCIAYDNHGRYLTAGSRSTVHIYDALHDFDSVSTLTDCPGHVRCLRFDDHCRSLVAGSVDHNLRIFGRESKQD